MFEDWDDKFAGNTTDGDGDDDGCTFKNLVSKLLHFFDITDGGA
jgi:hypothetical protein